MLVHGAVGIPWSLPWLCSGSSQSSSRLFGSPLVTALQETPANAADAVPRGVSRAVPMHLLCSSRRKGNASPELPTGILGCSAKCCHRAGRRQRPVCFWTRSALRAKLQNNLLSATGVHQRHQKYAARSRALI